jgi:hypothetical protein
LILFSCLARSPSLLLSAATFGTLLCSAWSFGSLWPAVAGSTLGTLIGGSVTFLEASNADVEYDTDALERGTGAYLTVVREFSIRLEREQLSKRIDVRRIIQDCERILDTTLTCH